MVVIAAVSAVAIWTVILMLFEDKFIFFPSRYPEGLYHSVPRGLHIQDHWFTTEDGVRLNGWFMPNDSGLGTLVVSHGNAGNISHRIDRLIRFKRAGFSVFLYDYRGYGRSDGSPTEEGIYRDGLAAFDYASKLPDVDPARMIIFGTSLGSAVAVEVATQRSATALVLETPFTSAKDMAGALYPFLPAKYLVRSRFDSEQKIRSIRTPVLIIHGTEDSIVPIELGKQLFDAANQPKEFYEIPGADHNNTFLIGGLEYESRLHAFAERFLNHPKR